MHSRHWPLPLVGLIAVCAGLACSPGVDTEERSSPVLKAPWNNLWKGGIVNICLKDAPNQYGASREDISKAHQMVIDTVTNTWVKEAGRLKFDFRCRSTTTGYDVFVYPERSADATGGHAFNVGEASRGKANVHFCAPSVPGNTCSQTRLDGVTVTVDPWQWFRAVVIHEFGHILGFEHEHQRRDVPAEVGGAMGWCDAAKTAMKIDGDHLSTSYDPASILNYCRDANNDRKHDVPWGDHLSDGDKRGIREAYPVCDSDAGPHPRCPGSTEAWQPGWGVCYWGHIQNLGWRYACNGDWVGTKDQSLRLEAVRIMSQVAGVSVCYAAHVQDQGWMGGCNGDLVGTVGQSRRIEALKVWNPGDKSVSYKGWVQNHGLHTGANQSVIGTEGQSLRLEAFAVTISD